MFPFTPQANMSALPLWKQQISTTLSWPPPAVPIKDKPLEPGTYSSSVIWQKDAMTLLSCDTGASAILIHYLI